MTAAGRDVVLQVSGISLDGFIAEEGTAFDEQATRLDDAERDQWMVSSINRADVHVMGRVTYESMANHWPNATEIFAEPMNRIPKAVFSKSLHDPSWGDNTRVLRGGIEQEVAALKAEPGSGEILVHGGAKFDQSMAAADAVDEYRLIVYPFVVGSGRALFAGVEGARQLNLVETVAFGSGCLAIVYRRRR